MPWYDFIWNDEPGGNVAHIADHGITPEEVEYVFATQWKRKSAVVQADQLRQVIRPRAG